MSRRPRRFSDGLADLIAAQTPATLLGRVQSAWPEVCGNGIASNSEPVSERDGVVSVACASGPWAQELEMMQDVLVERLRARIGSSDLAGLRFSADLARHRGQS